MNKAVESLIFFGSILFGVGGVGHVLFLLLGIWFFGGVLCLEPNTLLLFWEIVMTIIIIGFMGVGLLFAFRRAWRETE